MNTRYSLFATAAHFIRIRAFEPGKAGWKLDKDGKIEMKDGNPIWVDVNGGEQTLDGGTIARLNGDARTLRLRAETAEATLVPFKDIDPVQAKKALTTIANIDAKKLIDAGEVEKVKEEISKQFTQQLVEKDTAIKTLSGDLDNLRVDNIFAQSPFIRERVATPPDMFQATFRNNFKIKDGKPEAYDKAGNRIMSKTKFGEPADPDEALEILVDHHPQKAMILKASDHSGSGNNGTGGNRHGQRVIKRAEFDKLTPGEQAMTADKANKGELSIVD